MINKLNIVPKVIHPFHPSQFVRLRKFFAFGFILAVFYIGVFVPLAHATTYYVDSVGGLDANNGTSSSTPWQTIAKVNSSTFNPGDNILFKAGDTWREELIPPSSGASGTPIIFSSYGSGAQPIIDGANTLSGWASSSTVSGSVTQANMRLSTASGTAFVDFGSAGSLTPYIGSQITITDDAGKHLTGWIEATSSGETYGSELLSNTAFNNTSSISVANANIASVAGGQSGNALQVAPTTGSSGNAYEIVTAPSGALLLFSSYAELGTAAPWNVSLDIQENGGSYNYINSTYVGTASWTQYSTYATADMTSFRAVFESYGSGLTGLFDTASMKQVLTPSVTGVTIVSTQGGSIQNWTSEASGFNLNDSSGYTYSISTSLPNVYTVALATQPNRVFLNGAMATQGNSAATLTQHQWYWSGGTLYFYESAGSPDSVGDIINAGQRTNAMLIGGKQYISLSGMTFTMANFDNIFGNGNVTGLSVNGISSTYAGTAGLYIQEVSSTITNVTVTSSTFAYNGGIGLAAVVYQGATGWMWSGNTAHDNCQVSTETGEWQFCAGIYLLTANSSNVGGTVTRNISYDNGVSTSGGSQGNGIWLDSVTGGTVTYNLAYDNWNAGIMLEKNVSTTAMYNVVYNNTEWASQDTTDDKYANGNIYIRAGEGLSAIGNIIANNISYGGWWGIGCENEDVKVGTADSGLVTNNTFENNIAVGATAHNLWAAGGCNNDGTHGSGNVFMYNDFGIPASNFIFWNTTANTDGIDAGYSTYSSWETASGNCGLAGCSHSVEADPKFISTSTLNFTLQSSSPAINAGVNLGSAYDMGLDPASTWPSNIILDNENNYGGSSWEIGAYVYTQTSTPFISWTSPSSGTTISGSVALSASSSAVSPASISSLQFYLDGSPLGSPVTSTSSPNTYSYSWDTTGALNESHTLYALATDDYGNTASSSPITLNVSNSAPPPGVVVEVGGSYAPSPVTPTTTPSVAAPISTPGTSTVSSTPSSTSGIQAMIDTLTAELQSLEAQAGSGTVTYVFPRNLALFDTGTDVRILQEYLNDHGFLVSQTGPGSPGSETMKFGIKTWAALVKFQKSVSIPGTGYFGPTTRAYVNARR